MLKIVLEDSVLARQILKKGHLQECWWEKVIKEYIVQVIKDYIYWIIYHIKLQLM